MSHAAVAFGHNYGLPGLLTEPTHQQSAAGKPEDTACLKMQLHQWTPKGQSATAVADHDIALGTLPASHQQVAGPRGSLSAT
jgi:hypothetical protein